MSRLSRHLLLWIVGVADGELVIALTVSSLLGPPLQSLPVPSELQRFPLNVFFLVVGKNLFLTATMEGSALGSLGASALG